MDVSLGLKHNSGMEQHHAFLYLSDNLASLPLKEEYKVPSPDVTHVFVDGFGIDDARDMTLQATQKPVTLDKRVFVIVTRQITSEAQNALLKLFEEPPEQAVFYLAVPKEGILLPTLRSRLQLATPAVAESDTNEAFVSFLSASYAQRLELIAALVKEKDEKTLEEILAGAECYIGQQKEKKLSQLHSLLLVRSYVGMRGSSTKMLLEELSLSLPQA